MRKHALLLLSCLFLVSSFGYLYAQELSIENVGSQDVKDQPGPPQPEQTTTAHSDKRACPPPYRKCLADADVPAKIKEAAQTTWQISRAIGDLVDCDSPLRTSDEIQACYLKSLNSMNDKLLEVDPKNREIYILIDDYENRLTPNKDILDSFPDWVKFTRSVVSEYTTLSFMMEQRLGDPKLREARDKAHDLLGKFCDHAVAMGILMRDIYKDSKYKKEGKELYDEIFQAYTGPTKEFRALIIVMSEEDDKSGPPKP